MRQCMSIWNLTRMNGKRRRLQRFDFSPPLLQTDPTQTTRPGPELDVQPRCIPPRMRTGSKPPSSCSRGLRRLPTHPGRPGALSSSSEADIAVVDVVDREGENLPF